MLSALFLCKKEHKMERQVTNTMTIERKGIFEMKAYSFTTRSGRTVPQIILQGNWVEQWGIEIGFSVFVECYQNMLVILKD